MTAHLTRLTSLWPAFRGPSGVAPTTPGIPWAPRHFPARHFPPRHFPGVVRRGLSRSCLLLFDDDLKFNVLVPTDLGVLCAAVRDAIRAQFTLPDGSPIAPQAVNVGADRQTFPATTVPQVVVIPTPQNPHHPTVSGGGRRTPLRTGQITVIFISRYTRDRVDTANYMISDPTYGLYGWGLFGLEDILTTSFLEDADGNALSVEPLELAGGGHPRPYGQGFEFYGCEWTWNVKWLQRMSIRAGE